MTDLCRLIFWTLVDLMRARATLEAEIWVLRQQINDSKRYCAWELMLMPGPWNSRVRSPQSAAELSGLGFPRLGPFLFALGMGN